MGTRAAGRSTAPVVWVNVRCVRSCVCVCVCVCVRERERERERDREREREREQKPNRKTAAILFCKHSAIPGSAYIG